METITSIFLSLCSLLVIKAFEKSGENIADTLFEKAGKFINLLEEESPDIARKIATQEVLPNQYIEIAKQIEFVTKENEDLRLVIKELVETATKTSRLDLASIARGISKTVKDELPMINEIVNSLEEIDPNELQDYLPGATEEQVNRFADQLDRLQKLQVFFIKYPDDQKDYVNQLYQIRKTLDYKNPYRIAVIGESGSGKSTILNAMLGKDLLLSREGKAATGTALNIFLDAQSVNQEKVVIKYRNDINIRKLIKSELFERYKLESHKPDSLSLLTREINQEYLQRFRELKPDFLDIEETRERFTKLHRELVDIIEKFIGNPDLSTETLLLSKESDANKLRELIDENSDLNKTNNRKIGLVQSVTYSISPNNSFSDLETLQLPKNVCLVDLPGLGDNPLHDIIISEGIKDADAVVFVLRPPRIELASDQYLLERVKKYISFEGNIESGERIFFVLNAMDDVLSEKVMKDVYDLIERIVPGYTQASFSKRSGAQPYFLTSALAALLAQKKINGGLIDDQRLENKYSTFWETLNVKAKNDHALLEASQIPKLVENLSKFARERRIERQIEDSKKAISDIVNKLDENYMDRKESIVDGGIRSSESQAQDKLNQRKEKLIGLVDQFRRNTVIPKLSKEWKEDLVEKARNICNEIDRKLKLKMPDIWREAYSFAAYKPTSYRIENTKYEQVIGDTEAYLWRQFSERIPYLSTDLVDKYKKEIKAFKIARQVEESCLSYVKAIDVETKIDDWIKNKMSEKIRPVAERIALTKATDEQHRLIHFFEELKPTLEKISPSPDIKNLDKFEEFIGAIRQRYEPIIVNDCTVALLNLQIYDTLVVQEELIRYLEDKFREIPNSEDPVVKSKIDDLISEDPELKELRILEQKISDLSHLKSYS